MEQKPIKLVKNNDYIRSGRKSLGHLIRKYDITPTLECPWTVVHDLIEDGETFIEKMKPGTHKNNSHTVSKMMTRCNNSGELGEVDAEDVQQDSEYLAGIAVGTPPQHFMVDLDSGSSDLWLWSTLLDKDLRKKNAASGHNFFDPCKSSTWKDTASTWQIKYGDGSTAQGKVGMDEVTIGGIKIHNQGVELANKLSPSFEQSKGDGLCGLAFGTINTVKPAPVRTPVENMIGQSDIKAGTELFTAHLTNSKDNVTPCYTFGYIDSYLVGEGKIHYTPVDSSQGLWSVASTSARVNDLDLALVGGSAIMDTGTTLCLIDDNTCRAIYEAIPGYKYDANQGGYLYPTPTPLDKIPVVQFAIGDTLFTMHKQDMAFADAGNGMTYGGCQSRGNLNFSIYGCSVLKGMYAIFDSGKTRFGWVQKDDKSTSMENEATGRKTCAPAHADAHPKAAAAGHKH